MLLNRSSCYSSLLQYENALTDLDKVFYINSKQKAINIFSGENDKNKSTQENKNDININELNNIEFITNVKKAGVLNYLKRPKDALICYENALKIKEDKNIRENYQKISYFLKSS